MNRLNLLLATSLVTIAGAAHADTVLNLNATIPGYSVAGTTNNLAPSFYTTVNLGPGSYTATVLGAGYTASDGTKSVYSGWSQAATGIPGGLAGSNTWEERTGFSTGGTTFSSGNGQNIYNPYPNAADPQIFNINNGGNGSCNTAGNCYNSDSAALAAVKAAGIGTYSFTLTASTAVTFYIPDQSYGTQPGFSDNTGGVSLSLAAAPTPEPSSLILLGTGVMGLAGAVRRRFKK